MWGFFGSGGGGGAGGAPSGPAGGDLGSTYPNPTVVSVADVTTGVLPVANGGTGVNALGAGVVTFLGTPTSANLAAAMTDETGTGANVFATSPTLVTPSANSYGSVAGNDLTVTATAPAAITTAQNGNNAVFTGSDAVAGSSVAGAANGANVTLKAGNAQRLTSGSGAGGNVTISGGSGIGGGGNGNVSFSTAATSRWNISAAGNFLANTDNALDFGASGASRPRDVYIGRNEIITGLQATSAAAPTVASATTIAPVAQISFVSGTVNPVTTITAPAPIASGGGQITLIPTGLWTTTTAGNIALGTTAIVNKALIMTFDVTTAKWYPSY